MKFNDAVWGAVLMLFAGAILIHVQAFPKIPGQNVGPALFPGLIAVGLAVCGLLLVVRGLAARRAGADGSEWIWAPPWLRSRRHVLAYLTLVGACVFYMLAVDRIGFIPVGFVFLFVLMKVLRVTTTRAAVVSFLMTLVIHYAFYKMLRVPLPWGVLTNYAW